MFSLFTLIACGPASVTLGDAADLRTEAPDTGDTAADTGDSGDTGADTGADTSTPDTGDTAADTGDSGDSGDTSTPDTGDTGETGDTGDTAADTGDFGDTGEACGPLSAPAEITVSNATGFVSFTVEGCDTGVWAICYDSFVALYPPSKVEGPVTVEAWVIEWAYIGPDSTTCTIYGDSSSVSISVRVTE